MPQTIDLEAPRIRLRGADVEPEGIAWRLADPARRKAYFDELGRQAYRALFGQMLQGIGADGKKLKPVQPESRPDGAKGPPLNPHTVASRSARLLAYSGGKDGATVYWRGGWGAIVSYHARGLVRGAPIRDIVGLTAGRLRHAVYEARRWWARRIPPYGLPPLPTLGMTPLVPSGVVVKPRPPKPKPVPATPYVPANVEFHPGLDPQDRANFLTALATIPPPILARLEKAGVKIVFAEKLIDVRPDLAGVRPRGWPEGMTWEDAEGLHDPSSRQVIVSARRRIGANYEWSSRGAGVFRHELGHAVHVNLGDGGDLSETAAFRDAHAADVAALASREGLGYYLQKGDAGRREAFAELFAQLHGGGAAWSVDRDLVKFFPRSAQAIRKALQ